MNGYISGLTRIVQKPPYSAYPNRLFQVHCWPPVCCVWGVFSLIYLRRKKTAMLAAVPVREHIAAFGNLSFCASSSQFYNEKKEEIYFTSMQRSFMKMLMESEDKKVSIDDLCRKLWPGKENAKESLYTLVRRLKPIVESNTNLKIVTDKGGYYRLSLKNT